VGWLRTCGLIEDLCSAQLRPLGFCHDFEQWCFVAVAATRPCSTDALAEGQQRLFLYTCVAALQVIDDNHGKSNNKAGGLLAEAAAAAAQQQRQRQRSSSGSWICEGKQRVQPVLQQQQLVSQRSVGCAVCEDLVATWDGGQ